MTGFSDMLRQEVPVSETTRPGPGGDQEVVRSHPAFGVIRASRFQGGHFQLFGSPIKHNGGVTIQLSKAVEYYSLHRSWMHGTETIAEITLSEAQWATFVSTLNVGSGVPCTVRMAAEGPLDPKPLIQEDSWAEKRSADLRDKVAEDLGRLREAVRELDEVLKRPTIRKSDLQTVRHLLLKAVDQAPGSYQFAADSVTEHTEELVQAAKAEVSAFVTRMAVQFPQLAETAPELPQLPHRAVD
jgi:hypothetical protein